MQFINAIKFVLPYAAVLLLLLLLTEATSMDVCVERVLAFSELVNCHNAWQVVVVVATVVVRGGNCKQKFSVQFYFFYFFRFCVCSHWIIHICLVLCGEFCASFIPCVSKRESIRSAGLVEALDRLNILFILPDQLI